MFAVNVIRISMYALPPVGGGESCSSRRPNLRCLLPIVELGLSPVIATKPVVAVSAVSTLSTWGNFQIFLLNCCCLLSLIACGPEQLPSPPVLLLAGWLAGCRLLTQILEPRPVWNVALGPWVFEKAIGESDPGKIRSPTLLSAAVMGLMGERDGGYMSEVIVRLKQRARWEISFATDV